MNWAEIGHLPRIYFFLKNQQHMMCIQYLFLSMSKIKKGRQYFPRNQKTITQKRVFLEKFHLHEFFLLIVPYHATKVKKNYSMSWDINFEGFRSQLGQKNFFKTAIWLPHGQLWAIIEGQPHPSNVNQCVLHFRPEGRREPRNKVGSLSPAEHLLGIELGTCRFLLQRLKPLGHSPQSLEKIFRMDPGT